MCLMMLSDQPCHRHLSATLRFYVHCVWVARPSEELPVPLPPTDLDREGRADPHRAPRVVRAGPGAFVRGTCEDKEALRTASNNVARCYEYARTLGTAYNALTC